jgi:hypothetical protein
VQFGGLFKEDDPEFTTSDSVTELTIKASSKETIEIPVTEVGIGHILNRCLPMNSFSA